MKKPCIEFIVACSCCQVFADVVRNMAKEFPNVETKVYQAGEDMDYLPKYGAVSSSVLIVNEEEQITDISKSSIRKAFETANISIG